MFQKSINKSFTLDGKGLHFGKDVRIVVHPAPADHGIVFKRSDMKGDQAYIRACLLYTSPSPRDATLSRMPSSA